MNSKVKITRAELFGFIKSINSKVTKIEVMDHLINYYGNNGKVLATTCYDGDLEKGVWPLPAPYGYRLAQEGEPITNLPIIEMYASGESYVNFDKLYSLPNAKIPNKPGVLYYSPLKAPKGFKIVEHNELPPSTPEFWIRYNHIIKEWSYNIDKSVNSEMFTYASPIIEVPTGYELVPIRDIKDRKPLGHTKQLRVRFDGNHEWYDTINFSFTRAINGDIVLARSIPVTPAIPEGYVLVTDEEKSTVDRRSIPSSWKYWENGNWNDTSGEAIEDFYKETPYIRPTAWVKEQGIPEGYVLVTDKEKAAYCDLHTKGDVKIPKSWKYRSMATGICSMATGIWVDTNGLVGKAFLQLHDYIRPKEETNLPVPPEGYRFMVFGEEYSPKRGCMWWCTELKEWREATNEYKLANYHIEDDHPIIPIYRPATVEDAIKALQGEKIECRVRDDESETWKNTILISGCPTAMYPWCVKTQRGVTNWVYCEVKN